MESRLPNSDTTLFEPSAPSHHPRSGLDVVKRSDRPDGDRGTG